MLKAVLRSEAPRTSHVNCFCPSSDFPCQSTRCCVSSCEREFWLGSYTCSALALRLVCQSSSPLQEKLNPFPVCTPLGPGDLAACPDTCLSWGWSIALRSPETSDCPSCCALHLRPSLLLVQSSDLAFATCHPLPAFAPHRLAGGSFFLELHSIVGCP